MSYSLGPIHYLMYEKIKFQDKITSYLLDKDKLQDLNKVIPPVPLEKLDKILDQPNIHGFLSSKIDIVESRLAYAILNGENIYEKAYNLGEKIAPNNLDNYEDIFKNINTIILDGMPCDMAVSQTIDEKDRLIMITNIDTHEKYQNSPLSIDIKKSLNNTCEGNHDHDDHENFHIKKNLAFNFQDSDISKYYLLREALLKGFLSKSKLDIKRIGKNFIISK